VIFCTGCPQEHVNTNSHHEYETVLVVLGNEPLDDSTPTVDMVARVKRAVDFQKEHPGSFLIFTGGKTVGQTSEASMMAKIARSLGMRSDSFQLEEEATTTDENATFSAEIVNQMKPKQIFIVSKSDHLSWALPAFERLAVFKDAKPLACEVPREESIAQMREYLKHHDSLRVRQRLQRLTDQQEGTD
jgi:hypothetical protein